MDLKERERCEDREMEGCLVATREKCVGFAKDRCSMPFLEARIAVGEREIRNKVAGRIVHVVSMPVECTWRDLIGLDELGEWEFTVTNYKASQFMRSGSGAQFQA